MLLNSIQLFLRAEKQLTYAVAIATRGLHITSLLLQHNKYMQSEPLRKDIQDILQVPNPSDEQWNQVYNYFANEHNTKVMSPYLGILKFIKDIDEQGHDIKALKLYEHLKDNNIECNIAEKLAYMRICFANRNMVNEECKKELECLYDEFMTKAPYMDAKTLVICLEALSLTNRWKEVENVIQERKDLKMFTRRLHSCLALAYFKNYRFDKGWSVIKEAYENSSCIEHYVYIDLVDICGKNKNTFRNNVETIFELWGEYCYTPTKAVISEYIRVFRRLGLQAWFTTVFNSGQCTRCDTLLRKSEIHREEQEVLAKYALDHIIIGSDVYLKSHPKELENLQKFVETSKPYDVVIDGLNVYYKHYKHASRDSQRNVARVFRDLKQNAKGVVVVLRRHVRHDLPFMELLEGTKVFFTDDLSKDDPFLLYLAWCSEPNMKFISADIARDHFALLPNHRARMLFTKWMLRHRYYFGSKGIVIEPYQYDQTAHKNDAGWHVPYRKSDAPPVICFPSLNLKSEWACFQFV